MNLSETQTNCPLEQAIGTADRERLEQAKEIIRTVELLKGQVLQTFPDDGVIPALTPRQMVLLLTVRGRDGVSIKELADSLGVTNSSVSTMVERLVENGILTREPNPADRRGVLVRISPNMEAVIEPFEKQALRLLVDLLEKLGPETARAWRSLNNQIHGALVELVQKK